MMLSDGTFIDLTPDEVQMAVETARFQGRRDGSMEAERMMHHRQMQHDRYGYGYHDDYYRGRDRRPLPPMEPEELAAARAEIAAEWEGEWEFAENLRAALMMAIEMGENDADLEDILDVCRDGLTDQASPKLQGLRQSARFAMASAHDTAVQRHKSKIPNMPVHEPMPFKHHPSPSWEVQWGGDAMKADTGIYDELTAALTKIQKQMPPPTTTNPCNEQLVHYEYEEVEEMGSSKKYTIPVQIHVDKVTSAEGEESFHVSSTGGQTE